MATKSRFVRNTQRVRPRSARTPNKLVSKTLAYPFGFDSYTANDIVNQQKLRKVTDARIDKLGQYKTRYGNSFYSVPTGEASDVSESSATGAADQTVTRSTRFAQQFTPSTTGRVTKLTLSVKNDNSGTAPLRVDIYDDNSGEPGTLLGESSIPDTDIGATYADEVACFIDAPQVTASSDYWIVVYQQENGTNDYKLESTTNSTNALSSSDSGSSWTSESFSILFDVFVANDENVKGAFRAYKSNGTKKTLMAANTNLYSINDATGALTSIKSGLSSSATEYYFAKVNDVVYYVNGYDAPRKWDFTTEAVMGGSPAISKLITLHKNRLYLVDASDPNKIFFCDDDAEYESFTSTNFIYIPHPKSSEAITALESFNDVLYVYTERDKFALYGDDLYNFEVAKASGSKGTYAQYQTGQTRNHIYFIGDDGVYRFNGTTDELISLPVDDKFKSVLDRSKMRLHIHQNRVYVYYPSSGADAADTCLIYNIDHESWESEDLGQYVDRAVSYNGANDDNEMLIFSNRVGAGYKHEDSTNNYSDLGRPLVYELDTRYEHYDTPEAQKQVKRLYPRFDRESNSYSCTVKVDRNFEDSPSDIATIDLTSSSAEWNDGWQWGDGTTWGGQNFKNPRITIPDQSEYIKIIYYYKGVNTPINFKNHTQYVQPERAV